jgi:nitric oxide reductase NorQ protein
LTQLSQIQVERYGLEEEPYYLPVGKEVEVFNAAFKNRLPVMLKGPTGCGKSRFVRHMAYQLGRPLITVACHDDLTASDLVGRYLIKGGETVWVDGPLTEAVRKGAICYLDEIVEARKDTTVVIHPLTDDRRMLSIEKIGEILEAPPQFMLVISYNPGYQSLLKNLKHSTRQRFLAIEFDFLPRSPEMDVIHHETGVDLSVAGDLVTVAEKIRNLRDKGLEEPASTRLLVYAGHLIATGVEPKLACEVALVGPVADDPEMQRAISELISTVF